MSLHVISALKTGCPLSIRRPHGTLENVRPMRLALSRRRFARTIGGAAVIGVTTGSEMLLPKPAEAGSFAPVPIAGGTPDLGGSYHVFGPGANDPVDAEPSTITNFNGFIGLAFITGTVTRTNTGTGESLSLPFVNNDMRFMAGTFKGTDGRIHRGAFAFV